jgi:hypothetical protein
MSRPALYEIRPRKDKRGFDLVSDALPFGGLWYAGPNAFANALGYAKHRNRSHHAVIRVYDVAGNVGSKRTKRIAHCIRNFSRTCVAVSVEGIEGKDTRKGRDL